MDKTVAAEIIARLDDIGQRTKHTAIMEDCEFIKESILKDNPKVSAQDAVILLVKRQKRRGQVPCSCKNTGKMLSSGKPCPECQ